MSKSQPVTDANFNASVQAVSRPPGADKSELKQLEQLSAEMPVIEHMTAVMPAADFFFGGGMLLAIVLMHATGMRFLTDRFEARLQWVGRRMSTWRPDILLGGVVALMLMLHLLEIFAWSAALVYSGLVNNWRAAGFFAANTYTTVGYGASRALMAADFASWQRARGHRAPLPGGEIRRHQGPAGAAAAARACCRQAAARALTRHHRGGRCIVSRA
jgi:hypothetical protein